MTIDAALQAGLSGVQRGIETANRSAEKVATGFSGDDDVTEGILGLKDGLRQVQASKSVIKVVDKLIGEVVDLLA